MQARSASAPRQVLLPRHIDTTRPPAGSAVHAFGGLSMGTGWSVRVAAPQALPQLQQGLQQQLDLVVAQMSHWEDDSDLGRFNRAPAGSWQALPAAFFQVLAFAQSVAEASGGAYDPGAGALVNLWGFGPRRRYDQPGFVAPGKAQAQAVCRARAALSLTLEPAWGPDRAAGRARQPGGLLLDLSAVAKGYGVDRLASYLDGLGLHHYLVEVGGELRGAGVKPDGLPWWVALERVADCAVAGHDDSPAPARAASIALAGTDGLDSSAGAAPVSPVLALHGLAVATSGDYRRYFEQARQRYSHTIDPRSGLPIAHGVASVTVVHARCMAADAWSTALTVLGPEEGMALAERLGLAARFVLRGGDGWDERMSSQMRAMMEEAPCPQADERELNTAC